MLEFPDDTNGDVLRRLQAAGDDLSRPREVDFEHVFEEEAMARQFCSAVLARGYASKAVGEFSESLGAWSGRVVIHMVPTHERITRTEQWLDALAQEFNGWADGWGCFEVK